MNPPQNWTRTLALMVASAVLLYAGAAWMVGAEETVQALAELGWPLVLLGTALAMVNLLLRFARWQWLLRATGHVRGLTTSRSLMIYLAGIALTSTPGKAGETVRSVFLRRHGVAWPRSLACFLVDRASDLLGVALLGVLASLWRSQPSVPLLIVLVMCAAGSMAIAMVAQRFTHRWLAPLNAWAQLWHWPEVLRCTGVGVLAYGLQALVFAAFVRQLHDSIGWAHAVQMYVQAMLLGAASMLPGGLGATEAALVAQLTDQGVPGHQAVAVALALRLCTFWMATAVGVAALMALGRQAD